MDLLTTSPPQWSAPQPRPLVASRGAVGARLDAATGRAALLLAPGGYGKTSQVATWALADGRPVVWIDLDRSHNDPRTLLDTVAAALSSVTSFDLGSAATGRLTPRQFATVVVPALGRALDATVEPFVLVADGAEVVHSAGSGDVLSALLHHVPASSTVVLIGRAEPRIPLARMRADERVVDIGIGDLALDEQGVAAVLRAEGAQFGDESVTAVHGLTEGWPVGVRLAARAIVDTGSPSGTDLTPDRRMHGYVVEEWLRGLDEEQTDFLLRASCLDVLSAALCDHVLGRTDSGRMLEHIERSRIVVPLDRRGTSFRLHALLREVLEEELRRSDRAAHRTIHRRASAWFEEHRDVDRAVEHALAGDDVDGAERLIIAYAPLFQTSGRHGAVARWVAALPAERVRRNPHLCILSATVAWFDDDRALTETWLRNGTEALADCPPAVAVAAEHQLMSFQVFAHRGRLSDIIPAAMAASNAIATGPWRPIATFSAGFLQVAAGDFDLAEQLCTRAIAEARSVGASSMEAQAYAQLSFMASLRDDWDAAASFSRYALAPGEDGRFDHDAQAMVIVAMSALVAARAGTFDRARAAAAVARQHLADFSVGGDVMLTQTRLILARTALMMGEHRDARLLLDEAATRLREQPDATTLQQLYDDLGRRLQNARATAPDRHAALTTAELRLLHYLPTNLTLAEIAERIYVSRNTVKSHAASVYRKLGAATRSQAVELARAAGLLPAASGPSGY